jgi:HEAT repeat protein
MKTEMNLRKIRAGMAAVDLCLVMPLAALFLFVFNFDTETKAAVQAKVEAYKNPQDIKEKKPGWDGHSFSHLIADLGNDDFQNRINNIYRIGYIGPQAKSAVPGLVDELSIESMRESVLHSLIDIGPEAEDAIPALLKAIEEYAPACRWLAAEALANIGEAAVPALNKAAESENTYLRIWCNAALAKQQGTDSPNLRYLAQLMNGGNKKTAAEAVSALNMLGPISKPLVPDFIEALKHSVGSKKEIAFALAKIGKDAGPAVPELIKLIQDPDLLTSAEAIYAISQIGGQEAIKSVPSIIAALKIKDGTNKALTAHERETAATALGTIGYAARDAIPDLMIALEDKDEFVRANAATTIGNIDPTDMRAVPVLIKAMKDENGRVRVAAAQTLVKVGPVNKEVVLAFIEAANDNWAGVVYACDDFFSYLGPQHSYIVPDLIEMLKKPDERSKRLAITTLLKIGREASPSLPYILESIDNPNLEVYVFAVIPKLSANPEEIVLKLADILAERGRGSLAKRSLTAGALEKIGSSATDAIPALENCLELPGDPATVGFARALLAIDPQNTKAIVELERIAGTPYIPNQWTEQPDAHYLLIKYGHDIETHLQLLTEDLENQNSRIRLSAASYLGQLGTQANKANESLKKTFEDTEPDVRAVAANAILLISSNQSERKEACNILINLLDEKGFESRAVGALSAFGPLEKWSVPWLITKLQGNNKRLRLSAIEALGNIGQNAKEAIPYLEGLLKDGDWQIRQSVSQSIRRIQNSFSVRAEGQESIVTIENYDHSV